MHHSINQLSPEPHNAAKRFPTHATPAAGSTVTVNPTSEAVQVGLALLSRPQTRSNASDGEVETPLPATPADRPVGRLGTAMIPWPCIGVVLGLAGLCLGSLPGHAAETPAWQLAWSDEFDQPDGSAPSGTNWVYDLGGGGWGNQELETYTSRRVNSRIEEGMLVIEARKESFTGTDHIARDYTSARLKTQGRGAWTYGRIEARMKLPSGQGIWPAFWMLGTNISTAGWPGCGEIDIMENIGREPSIVHATLHGPGYSGGKGIGTGKTLPGGQKLSDAFHVYSIEWETNRIRWFYDNQLYFTVTPAQLPDGAKWVFDHPHFIILNLAVGGAWPGNPDTTTVFPQKLVVDYVRVYKPSTDRPRVSIQRQEPSARLRWPLTLPQATLERAPTLADSWTTPAEEGTLDGLNVVVAAPPGFYRLRW